MAKYFIQRENLVSIADEVRTISGVANTLPINTMKSSLQEANNNINTESELISQIMSALQGKTNVAISEISIKTATKKLSSNGTTITFEGLTQEPKVFAITPTGNISLSSTRYVTGVMYDGETTSGTYGYRSSSTGTSYYSASYFTWTYSNGTLSVKTSSSTNGGNFSSSVTYKLVYVEVSEGSGSSSGGVSLPTLTNEGSASDLLSGKQLIDSKGNIVTGTLEGVELNFEIIGGTTQPSNPKENTIWVNTSRTITDYIFSADQPSNPVSGMVWIEIGVSSSTSFDIIDNVTLHPINAMQYVNGSWVKVDAMIRQNNTWAEWWNGELFDNGNQYESVTGGWARNSELYLQNSGSNNGTVAIDDKITLYPSVSTSQSSVVTTKNKVNLTDFDTLQVKHESDSGNYWVFVHSITSGDLETNYVATSGKVETTGVAEATVDISALTGEYYISVGTKNKRNAIIETIKILK